MVEAVRVDLGPRLEAAAEEVEQLRETLARHLQQRNELIVQAVDEGMTQAAAARAANVRPSTVTAILAGSQVQYETGVVVDGAT
jgi:predicted transcriptional regulator